MGKIVITKQNNRLLLTLFEQNKPELFSVTYCPEEKGMLGNIYLARVKDVVPPVKGAFLNISADEKVYLPFSECKKRLISNRELSIDSIEEAELKQGDEVVVQVSGEAIKTKPPSATCNLTLKGQYCVCEYFGHGLKFSKKISDEKQKELTEEIRRKEIQGRKKYGSVIRTNARELRDYGPLYEEMQKFIAVFDGITDTYRYRTYYSCFYRKEAEIISAVKNIQISSYDEIVTDVESVYCLLSEVFREEKSSEDVFLRFYQDDMLTLAKLYNIEKHLQDALGKRVWLPCGGYLVIEQTEAMVVIDVNSGKAQGKGKKYEQFILSVNLEAAKEVARQLRLRNYSGMIMVDFINMEPKKDKELLLKTLENHLKEDKIRTRLIDMTALGIVEITRKKESKPLADYF